MAGTAGICLGTCLGCTDGATEDVRVERTDSAGVAIVTYHGPDVPLHWQFRPVLSLGGADSGEEAFFRILPWSVGADASGRIYVLDAENHRVVGFDSLGNHVLTLGRQGAGPGELQQPASLAVSEAGVVNAFDHAKGALVRFAADGAVLPAEPWENLAYRGGRIASLHGGFAFGARELDRQRELERKSLVVLAKQDTVTLASTENPVVSVVYASCGGVYMMLSPLFSQDLEWAASRQRIAVSSRPDYVVDVFAGDRHVASLRRDLSPRRVTEEMALREFGVGETWTIGDQGRCTVPPAELLEQRGHAATIPLIGDLAVAPDGTVWVKRLALKSEVAPIDLFGPEGDYVGTLSGESPFPAAFLPNGSVLAVEKDELDVERLVLYEVSRESSR